MLSLRFTFRFQFNFFFFILLLSLSLPFYLFISPTFHFLSPAMRFLFFFGRTHSFSVLSSSYLLTALRPFSLHPFVQLISFILRICVACRSDVGVGVAFSLASIGCERPGKWP